MLWVVLCRAVALLLFRLADVSLFRSGFIPGPLLFIPGVPSLACVRIAPGIMHATGGDQSEVMRGVSK